MSLKKRSALAMVSAALLMLNLVGAALAHAPHTAGPKDQVLANSQNHGPYLNGVSCGGAPSAYGIETAHHGPDAGISGKADGDGCYRTTGIDRNPAID